MSRRFAATHPYAGEAELLADRSPGNAQLSTDVAQGPALGVQGGCTLNIHRATVTNPHQIDLVRCPAYLPKAVSPLPLHDKLNLQRT
jgi:hypothetical protein